MVGSILVSGLCTRCGEHHGLTARDATHTLCPACRDLANQRCCVRCGRSKDVGAFSNAPHICIACSRPQHQFALEGLAEQHDYQTGSGDVEISSFLHDRHDEIVDQLGESLDRHRCVCFSSCNIGSIDMNDSVVFFHSRQVFYTHKCFSTDYVDLIYDFIRE